MCVTNTTFRRSQPISLAQQQQQSNNGATTSTTSLGCPSGLTQRLMGTFQLTAPAQPQQAHTQQPAFPVVSTNAASAAAAEKPRPKRRRKPQKPGKTAKMNDRHFVVHNYHDHALDTEDMFEGNDAQHAEEEQASRRKGGVAVAFPLKLHAILDQVERDGLGHVVSWQAHGRCFVIHQPKEFVASVMPKYFRQTKLTSFQRQLNLYGFCRLTRGNDAGGYYHELFLRGKPFLCKRMIRTKVKGTKFKAASSPDQEPDFYAMPAVVVTPQQSPVSSPQHQPYSDESASDSISAAPIAPSNDLASMFSTSAMAPLQQMQAQQQSMEPFAFQQPQFPAQMQLNAFEQAAAQQQPVAFQQAPVMNPADQVLDEAVNELFLNPTAPSSSLEAEMNEIDEFVRDWEQPNNFAQTLDNDLALGFMLDKLLED